MKRITCDVEFVQFSNCNKFTIERNVFVENDLRISFSEVTLKFGDVTKCLLLSFISCDLLLVCSYCLRLLNTNSH